MKCPYCGYDKIQSAFNFCPSCKHPLTEQDKNQKSPIPNTHNSRDNDEIRIVDYERPAEERINEYVHPAKAEEKGFLNRAFSRWTYERAIADPYAYASWAYRNPNDNRVFLERWNREGNDLSAIRQAISEANRARQENPTVDRSEVEANIIDSNQQSARRQSNSTFVQTVNADYTTDAAAIVRNKAIWKLQPGELARHIAPDEWVYVSEHLEGLVIEEGTSAIIYIDGQEVAQMGSGMYVFDNKHAAAAEMEAERRKHEHQGILSRMADGIYRFFTGHKREESTREKEERRRRIQQIMGKLKKDTIIDVYLKSDRVFPAIFGQQHLSDTPDGYQPYVIQSRYLDLNVGVSMQMRIGNFKEFIANYMAGTKSVSIADVVKSADGSVYSILRFRLRDIEVTERGLDEQTFNAIKEHLKQNLPNILHGVVVIDVLDIATSNEQLARFRQVEEQLYCSEREYDFLQRTNEFRNRIASEENDQKIREARSEQELRVRLDEVNKDNLLHTDEMEQFVSLLMNQKVIREATNKADLDQAMLEIQRNSLIAQEEFDIFSADLENRRFDRDQVSEQLRARSLMATALQKLEVDKTLELANIRKADEISDAEWEVFRKQKGREAEGWDLDATIYGRRFVFEKQQLLDEIEKRRIQNAYTLEEAQNANKISAIELEKERQVNDFEREETLKQHDIEETIKEDEYRHITREKEDDYKRNIREKEDELRLLREKIEIEQSAQDREAKRALENLLTIKEMELSELKEQHAHEQSMANIEADVKKTEIEAESNMSADQLLGKNISQMDAAAQTAFAESFSHLNEIELTKANAAEQAKLYQQMVEMAKENGVNIRNIQSANQAQQMEMMKQVLAAVTQMSASQATGQQGLINSMVGAIQSVASGQIETQKEMKAEAQNRAAHAESRLDETQKQALNYTSRVAVSENMPNVVGGTSVNVNVGKRVCPSCGQPLEDDMNVCPICGRELK